MERFQQGLETWAEFRSDLSPRQDRFLETFLFLSKFTLLAAPFYLVLNSGWTAEGLRALNAQISSSLLQIIGIEASSTGSFVRTEGMFLDVTRDSTGWKSAVVFSALVLASSRDLRNKLGGILVGVLILAGLNVLRIVSMVYAVEILGMDYELLHTVLWRWGLTAGVIGAWLVWMWITSPKTGGFQVPGR